MEKDCAVTEVMLLMAADVASQNLCSDHCLMNFHSFQFQTPHSEFLTIHFFSSVQNFVSSLFY